ncbi:hypothetical protein EV421DRAFT_244207 [Armillaria borealis]|uniref:Secreted protein n=1 Tax=Armillaria borealis TaxID=47425 RepID=A0AA39IX25_9AGAR|nr:hypothetical protein EV421DRAFT_244207 [Armillaria borealis]
MCIEVQTFRLATLLVICGALRRPLLSLLVATPTVTLQDELGHCKAYSCQCIEGGKVRRHNEGLEIQRVRLGSPQRFVD